MSFNWVRGKITLYAFTLVLLMSSTTTPAASFKSYEVKAVYLFRIANFIRWNDESTMDTVNFCVIGDKKISQVLTEITAGKSIRSLAINVQQSITFLCDITYFSELSDSQFTRKDHSPHTVTISDIPNFTDMGGVIELTHIDNKLKPKINLANAKQGEYVIGSNLLRIAIVEDK